MFKFPFMDQRGAISVIGALFLPALIGMAGLVAEYGNGVLAKTQDQRVADLAAYAGAVAYSSTASTTTMTSVIDKVANLNGIATANIAGSLVTSPSGDGNQAVKVVINNTVPLVISRVLNTGPTLPVQGTSYAELNPNAAGCIIALNTAGSGVTLSGGTAVTADACAVDSNNTVTVPCGDTITTILVAYDSSSAPSQPCSGIQPPSGKTLALKKALTADPLAGNSAVSTATARLANVAAMSNPAAPSVTGGTDVDFGFSASTTQGEVTADGCSSTFASPVWTVTCASGGTYHFGNINVHGGITVNFAVGGSATNTYDFSGAVNSSGSAMTFGPGTYNIAGGLTTSGGTTTTFAAGTFNIGRSASACGGAGKYSICHQGTNLTFGGPSTFVLQGGINNKGGSALTLGSGSTNSYNIGASSDGNALYAGGGSSTFFADATGGSDIFQMTGALNMGAGGGSCLNLPAAAQHDINGPFTSAGGTIMGSGIYTVHGYIALGGSAGGDVTCWGSTVGLSGANVTFVTDGSSLPSSGTCSGDAFCAAAGYGHVTLTAPTTGTMADLAVIGPISNTAGASFGEGASNTTFSGVFYMPNGPITLSGSATVGPGAGPCFEMIGSQVTLGGGTALASNCISGASTGASVILVQ